MDDGSTAGFAEPRAEMMVPTELGLQPQPKARVLVIDDDTELLTLVNSWLSERGFEVLTAHDGYEGLRCLYQSQPDVVLLDIVLPDLDGWEVCRRLRQMCDTPVIMLTGRSAVEERVRGLDMGADDYVIKPFDLLELDARIKAALRRVQAGGPAQKRPMLICGRLWLDIAAHQAYVDGRAVRLSPTEFRLLECLMQNQGKVVTHQQLLSKAWGPEYVAYTSSLKVYIRYLRQKVEESPDNPNIILTERGIGYRLAGN